MNGRAPRAPGLRGRLLLSVLGAIAVVLAVLTVAFNVVLADRLGRDADGVAQARVSAEIAALRVVQGRIVLPEAPDDRTPEIQLWVFQGQRLLEQPRATAGEDRAAQALAARAPASVDLAATDTRLYGLPVAQSHGRIGAVVAGVSLAPYEQTRATALVGSAILAVAVFVAFGLAARWLIDRALRPVARMTRQASEWSEGDLDRRFGLGAPRDELTQLAHTLDDLLGRLAMSLRHEQRLSAEISHELRTPLASIVAEAQYALRHGDASSETRAGLEHILSGARQLSRTLDTLMAAARSGLALPRASSDAVACARRALSATVPADAACRLELVVDAPVDPVPVALEGDLVERILAPLIDNAVGHARHSVRVELAQEDDAVRITVEDDGPGVAAEEREAIFEPGYRGGGPTAQAALASRGAGLGLALCRRLATTAGGAVTVEASSAGGRFVVRLPGARP